MGMAVSMGTGMRTVFAYSPCFSIHLHLPSLFNNMNSMILGLDKENLKWIEMKRLKEEEKKDEYCKRDCSLAFLPVRSAKAFRVYLTFMGRILGRTTIISINALLQAWNMKWEVTSVRSHHELVKVWFSHSLQRFEIYVWDTIRGDTSVSSTSQRVNFCSFFLSSFHSWFNSFMNSKQTIQQSTEWQNWLIERSDRLASTPDLFSELGTPQSHSLWQ